MRAPRFALALGLAAVLLLFGCRSPKSPTTSLEDIPRAGGMYAPAPGASVSDLSSLQGSSATPFGLEPPSLPLSEQEEIPLPSRRMLPEHGRQMTIDRVVGRVNKDIITLSEVQELAQHLTARIPPDWPEEKRREEVLKIQNVVLDRIIEQRLQIQHAERLGVLASDKELDDAVLEVMAKNNLRPEQFEALLKREGLTMQQYRDKIQEQIVRRRVYDFEVMGQVQVSDADVKDYYLDHIDQFIPPPAVLLSQIFINLPSNGDEIARQAARKKADLVLESLRQGEPFSEVARSMSEDPSKLQGGKLGRFAKGEMLPKLEEVAFQMREGEIRGPIDTDRGLHLIKVDQRWGDKPLPLETVSDRVRAFILNNKAKERYQSWMEVLRGDAFIERVDLRKLPPNGG